MNFDSGVIIGAAVCEGIVFALLMRQKVYKALPVFCAYIGWSLLSDGVTAYMLPASSGLYLKYYMVEMPVDSVLQFFVIVELAWSILKPVRKSLPSASLLVLIVLIALAGLAVWPIAGRAVSPNLVHRDEVVAQLSQTFAILRVACFLILASFSQVLSIGWKNRELQIATGFGFFSIISLLVAMLHSHQQATDQYDWLNKAAACGYVGSLLYWVLSFSTREQERREFSPQMQHFLLQMGGGARAGRIALTDLPKDRLRKKD